MFQKAFALVLLGMLVIGGGGLAYDAMSGGGMGLGAFAGEEDDHDDDDDDDDDDEEGDDDDDD